MFVIKTDTRTEIRTEKLYYQDSYLSEFSAVVTDCAEDSEGYRVTLDRTAFYPVGGGQPWDTGTIGGVKVVSVREQKGVVIHQTEAPIEKDSPVLCKVDWQARFSLMQEHTGEHIVSGIIKKLYGYNNIGFHMGSECVTLDIDGTITQDDVAAIERAANEAVYKNIPVVSKFIGCGELAEIDFRSKKDFDEDVRIVHIEDCDTCACCGIHVRSTGEIGIIKITDCQKYKKGMRLSMLCGRRAVEDYIRKNEYVRNISELLSAKRYEVTDAVKRLLDENTALKQRISEYEFKHLTQIADSVPEGSGVVCIFEGGLSAGELRKLCVAACEKAYVAAVFSENSGLYKYALGSSRADIRPLTEELNARFSGKGGGNKNITGGTVSGNEQDIRAFFMELNSRN